MATKKEIHETENNISRANAGDVKVYHRHICTYVVRAVVTGCPSHDEVETVLELRLCFLPPIVCFGWFTRR